MIYNLRKGPKIKIGKIIIKGNSVTHDKVIRREMRIVENSYYSESAIELSKMRLYQLGYFEEVNFSTPRGDSENIVDIVVEVKERNTGQFNIGGGFSTLESFILTASIQKENFLGVGTSGAITMNLSKLRQDIIVSVSDRYFLDTKWYASLTFQRYMSQLNRDFDQDRLGVNVGFGKELFDFFHFRIGYELEDITVTNFSQLVPEFFQRIDSGLTSAIQTSIAYDRRDNRVVTKKGVYASLGADVSSHYLGASNNYIRTTSDLRYFAKLPYEFILRTRATASYINSTESNPIPLYDRFFMGGMNTLRGYDISSIGPSMQVPRSTTGGDEVFVFGGNKMVLMNLEVEIPLYPTGGFYGVTFLDGGNAFAEDQTLDLTSLRYDYGFGVRWQSPLGTLRFEWGFPIDKREGETGSVFNFGIGQNF